jgi:hypothetical protein
MSREIQRQLQPQAQPQPQPDQPESDESQVLLVNVPVTDQNVALNLMISFLSLANKRGAFGIDESAKIWECIQIFQNPV